VSPTPVSTGLLPGPAVLAETVADNILERARAGKADLIVMATHGRGPLGRESREGQEPRWKSPPRRIGCVNGPQFPDP